MACPTSKIAARAVLAGLLGLMSAGYAGACQFSTGAGTLHFGLLDPDQGAAITTSLSLAIDCPAGRPPAIALEVDGQPLAGNGLDRALRQPGKHAIAYTLRLVQGASRPGRAQPNLVLEGVITPGALRRAAAGRYEDQFVLCLLP